MILECCTPLFEEVSHNEDEELVAPVPLSPSSLFFLLQTQLLLHQRGIKLASPALHRLFAANAEVSPARLATLMPIYAASTTVYPKVHPLWTASIAYIQAFSDSPDVTLVEWWNAVTTAVLPTSVERKAWEPRAWLRHRTCIKVFCLLFKALPASCFGSLLNAKFTRMLQANAGGKKLLHNQTVRLFKWFLEVGASARREA